MRPGELDRRLQSIFVYRYFDPWYHRWVVLECDADTKQEAWESALRFIRHRSLRMRENTDGRWSIKLPKLADIELRQPPPS